MSKALRFILRGPIVRRLRPLSGPADSSQRISFAIHFSMLSECHHGARAQWPLPPVAPQQHPPFFFCCAVASSSPGVCC